MKIGYVVKRYPRFSETFIVSEIVAHEAAGEDVRIYALRPSYDSHFQNILSRVRAPVTYLTVENMRLAEFWMHLTAAAAEFPRAAQELLPGAGETPAEVCQAIALAREARRAGLHHLHAHFATSATTVARLASRLSGIPYTFTAHAKDIYHESVEGHGFDRKLADAACCVTVSDFNRTFLAQRYAGIAAPVVRIYNGLHLDDFPYERPAERERTILAVGRLVEKKGFADLVDACAVLRDSGERFSCRIVGTGPLEAALRARIDECGVSEWVTLAGALPQEDVIREMQAATALAVPCVVGADGDRDGLPTVMLEAMALGTPIVATSVTGIPEAVRDLETGLLVPEHDPQALALALARLLHDAPLRVRLADAARRHIEAAFDIRGNAALLRDVFAQSAPMPQLQRV